MSPRHSPRAARKAPAPCENAYGELRAPPLPPRKSLSPAEPAIVAASSVQDIAAASAPGNSSPYYASFSGSACQKGSWPLIAIL